MTRCLNAVFSAMLLNAVCTTSFIQQIRYSCYKSITWRQTLLMSSGPTDGERKDEGQTGPEISLPLSFRSDNITSDGDLFGEDLNTSSSNPYFDIVGRLSPSEHIQRFMHVTPSRVQEAVRNTVMGLLGSLPRHAFQTVSLGTGDALANLMFQLQMTGYMFKNAEYRLSLQMSLQDASDNKQADTMALLSGKKDIATINSITPLDEDGNIILKKPTIHGKVKLSYESGQEIEVDAEAYMAELSTQVETLQNKLAVIESKQKEAASKDLLLFIRSMPTTEMLNLSSDISPEVLECMKMLVQAVMRGMNAPGIGKQAITQQTGQGMAQLCMWQLAVGYSLREMEVRQELKQLLKATDSE